MAENLKHFEIEDDGDWLRLALSPRGRLQAGLERFLVVTPLTALGLSLLYLPDYLGKYAGGPAEETALFWASMMAIALGVGSLFALVRGLKLESWILDPGEGALIFQRKMPGRSPYQEALALDDLLRFELRTGQKRARLSAILRSQDSEQHKEGEGGPSMPLFESRHRQELELLTDALRRFARRRRLNIPIERSSTS